ncbi:carbon-nitrogen hydrolase family protein [Fulvivirgaceae bacterium BMA10]|uniref:Carbon-nitrogen hydrolase family protein n=1 Tax=Splendidivirga corallicola TaxID=3051826 RepID=A0ABT8KXT9_9BACT|nr:carbon-nitrogen hydrolase family protein [Fulvivirgaceae bacterium BMA10]
MRSVVVSIIQQAPIHLSLNESLEKALHYGNEAAKKGAQMIVFGETWLSGYPAWLDHCPDVALWDHEPVKEAFAKLYNSSISIPGPEIQKFQQLAKKKKIVICLGANEVRKTGKGNGTVYNALLTINADGQLVNHHRKLMPTYTEKMLYGQGDGKGLKSVDTEYGRVSGLICWEHWMPLSRQALHDSGEEIHVAVWPKVHEMHQVASRQYAFEGRCFVIAAGQMMRVKDVPDGLKLPDHLIGKPEEFLLNGGSCIIAPNGKFIMEPVFDREEILMAEINLDDIYKERMTLDVTGHYARDDVFDFKVKRKRKV